MGDVPPIPIMGGVGQGGRSKTERIYGYICLKESDTLAMDTGVKG